MCSFKVKLIRDGLKEIEDVVPISEVAGNRTIVAFVQCTWKFANTLKHIDNSANFVFHA